MILTSDHLPCDANACLDRMWCIQRGMCKAVHCDWQPPIVPPTSPGDLARFLGKSQYIRTGQVYGIAGIKTLGKHVVRHA